MRVLPVYRSRMPSRLLALSFFALVVTTTITLSCTERERVPSTDADPVVQKGRQLAGEHCSTCHAPVAPSSLDRETWTQGVLPAMASRMGIQVMWDDHYFKEEGARNASSDTTVTLSEWRAIVEYFESQAPDSLLLPPPDPHLQRDLPGFSVREPPPRDRRAPATAMVEIDSLRRHIYTGHVTSERTYRWTPDLERSAVEVPSMKGVETQFVRDSAGARHAVFTDIGTMRAVNDTSGAVRALNLDTGAHTLLFDNLARPVCARPGDFDRDGRRDWIVCGFGHTIGSLSLFEQRADGTYRKTVLRDVPGAVDAEVGDFNDDGWLDVMALFGHSREGVWLFLNDREGGFEQKQLLEFPPHYGSSSFQVTDFNDDGRPDILYTSGDNADYSTILKPFHGAYVYLNQGDFQYEKRYFYHLNGATEAIARDFDGDGDLDIAMIGFFADIRDPSGQDFVYLEQTEEMTFLPHAPPIEDRGRWIRMDAGDYDGDGDEDLVLGNFARRYSGSGGEPSSMLPFLVLENDRR